MQSNRARTLLALTAVVIIIVGFLVLRGEDSEVGVGSADPPVVSSGPRGTTSADGRGEGGAPADGVTDLEYEVGDQIRFAVESDVADEVHVHGFDIEEAVGAGETVELDFPADRAGIYEVELHESATPIVRLTIKP